MNLGAIKRSFISITSPSGRAVIAEAIDQTSQEIGPLSLGEIEVKSLPPSGEDTTIPAVNGTEIVEPDSSVQPQLIPGLPPPGESAFIPGPAEPSGQPSGADLSQLVPGYELPQPVPGYELPQPGALTILSPADICQEQWYLPECAPNGNGPEEIEDSEDPLQQAPYFDEGGYQQLPYYYEPGGYQEGEDQYTEDSSNEVDDYEGGYQEYEQDYSEEEDSGDEEDEYEEVGGYQEEEEDYSEEEVGESDGEEEEDFTEEEEESVEYYEE